MPPVRTPRGVTPPAPGLEREEPTFVPESDIPTESRGGARDEARAQEEGPTGHPRKPERE